MTWMDLPHRLRSVLLDNTAEEGHGVRLAFLLLALFAEMERTLYR